MLKSDIEYPISRRYASDSEWQPVGFFSDGLCNSTQFDLLLGFFASSAISVLSDGFATFLYNGGKMRLVINDILSEEDKNAVINASSEVVLSAFNLQNIDEIKTTLSERDSHFFECLSWLIRNERISIKVIAPKNSKGIAHTKCGIFSDGLNKVAFEGSCNFSKSALIDNIESISAFCDWDSNTDQARVQNIEQAFERTFNETNEDVIYLSATSIKSRITNSFANKELTELLHDEEKLLQEHLQEPLPKSILKALENAHRKVAHIIKQQQEKIKPNKVDKLPHFPYPTGPREYQRQAFENWKVNGQKGLFAMATGTGKTITSLNCLLEIYKRRGYYKALILVPTIALVEQWEKECQKFNFNKIYKVYSKAHGWQKNISNLKLLELTNNREPISYIIISTYASFCRPLVFQELMGFPKNKLLLIADEAHNMGGGLLLKKIDIIPYLRRIGLSATPERQYDTEANEKLLDFFGCKDEYTFTYNMQEAIENGALCEYYYYPHIVSLTDSEMLEYIEVTNKIVKFMGYDDEESQDILMRLLLKRKRIIHKAENKKSVFKEIIKRRWEEKESLHFSLIYVPEGMKPQVRPSIQDAEDDNYIDKDFIETEDEHLIDEYTSIVRDTAPHVTVKQFTSDSPNREQILEDYANGVIDVLTSMKCLDEGVDVPRSEFAVFCSSTGNPRQFIQRRGRVLRLHKDKKYAVIHDLIVVPNYISEETFQLEKNLILGELKRVREFALLSKNCNEAIRTLDPYLQKYEISIFNT